LAALGLFELDDPRFDPALVLEHVRAINARYADGTPVNVNPQYVSRLLAQAGGPRSKCSDLMKNETIPAEPLLARRMQVMTPALIGQLNATANWDRSMSERIYGSLPATPRDRTEARFFGTAGPSRSAALGMSQRRGRMISWGGARSGSQRSPGPRGRLSQIRGAIASTG
jgi:hypothetical protein